MGFSVDKDGNLVNIKPDGTVTTKNCMSKALKTALERNGIDFKEDYDSWEK